MDRDRFNIKTKMAAVYMMTGQQFCVLSQRMLNSMSDMRLFTNLYIRNDFLLNFHVVLVVFVSVSFVVSRIIVSYF